jgi:hypothetical protein
MPAEPISAEVLAAAFPNLRGFNFINAGSYKSVYRVERPDKVVEVLKVIRLPLEGANEDEKAIRRQELGRAQRALWTQQQTVHRDIKPGNIFATGLESRPYVLILALPTMFASPGSRQNRISSQQRRGIWLRRCWTRTSARI